MSETKHLTFLKTEKLAPAETVIGWLQAYRGDDALTGIAFVSERRVGYCRKGVLGEKFEFIEVGKVSSIEVSSFLGYRTIKIYTSNDSLVLKTYASKAETTGFVAAIEAHQDRQRSSGPHVQGGPATGADPVAQLARLGELRERGVLSAEEFDAKKRELLSRI